MRHTKKKLSVSRETLKSLSNSELRQAGGGDIVVAAEPYTQPRCGFGVQSQSNIVLNFCCLFGTFDDPKKAPIDPAG